jgi:hypothetical protein
MTYLNARAQGVIANALRDAKETYGKLANNEELPGRLRQQYAAERHMARTLADLFECHPTFHVEGVFPNDYGSTIWDEGTVWEQHSERPSRGKRSLKN